ncbi:hypothetical protein MSS93_09905 [Deinococcus radiodurans]|nr:hypothetical protein MSS93_09905 [Deinococcus radiodurans]
MQGITGQLSASWADEEYSTRYQTAAIYRAMRAHPAPLNVERAAPDRREVNALTLPRVTAAYRYDRAAPAAQGAALSAAGRLRSPTLTGLPMRA